MWGGTTVTVPDAPALRAPKAAGMATAHRKLATDRPACLPTGATLARESVVDTDFIMAIKTSTVKANGARCSRLASSMGYVTCDTGGRVGVRQMRDGSLLGGVCRFCTVLVM